VFFCKHTKTQRRKGRETKLPASTTLPCLRTTYNYHKPKVCVFELLDLRREFQIQRRRGERMSFYTFAAKPRLYLCWAAKRVETQRRRERERFTTFIAVDCPRMVTCWAAKRVETQRRRERERDLLPLSRPIDRVWLRAGFEKRVPNPAKKGERKCVDSLSSSPRPIRDRMSIYVPGQSNHARRLY
jgi:hypothetical protein